MTVDEMKSEIKRLVHLIATDPTEGAKQANAMSHELRMFILFNDDSVEEIRNALKEKP